MSAELPAVWPSDAPRKALTWQTTNAWRHALQRFDSHVYTRLQCVQLPCSRLREDVEWVTRTTMTTPRLRMTINSIRMMTTPVTTPVRQRPYQLTQLQCWLLRGVSRGTAWYTDRAGAASVSRVPTKCTTKDAAVLFATRLSTCCCVCTNLTYAWTCVWQ